MAEDKLYRVVKASDRLPDVSKYLLFDTPEGPYNGYFNKEGGYFENSSREKFDKFYAVEWYEEYTPPPPPESLEELEEEIWEWLLIKPTSVPRDMIFERWKECIKPKIASLLSEKDEKIVQLLWNHYKENGGYTKTAASFIEKFNGEKWEYDKDNEIVYRITPKMQQQIQSLQSELESARSRIKELEGK